jgi:hypothetical protein
VSYTERLYRAKIVQGHALVACENRITHRTRNQIS